MAKILVVEDDRVNQRVLSHTLRRSHHSVITAQNGRIALDMLAQESVDLIITDLTMPEMDGLTLLKHLRADDRYKALPIIMITGDIQDQTIISAREEGINDFLNKPTSSWELLETVNRCLSETGDQHVNTETNG